MDKIEFTGNNAPDSNTDSLSFEAMCDGRRIVCKISHEALEDHFRLSDYKNISEAYLSNRYKIEEIATKLIRMGRFEKENIIRIFSHDI